MIDWDAPDEPDYTLIPIEQLHAEAEAISLSVEIRELEVVIEGLRRSLAKIRERSDSL